MHTRPHSNDEPPISTSQGESRHRMTNAGRNYRRLVAHVEFSVCPAPSAQPLRITAHPSSRTSPYFDVPTRPIHSLATLFAKLAIYLGEERDFNKVSDLWEGGNRRKPNYLSVPHPLCLSPSSAILLFRVTRCCAFVSTPQTVRVNFATVGK